MNGYQISIMVLFAPTDGFLAIKKDRENFSYLAPTLIYLWCVFANVMKLFLVHYPLSTVNVLDVNLFQQVFSFVIPVFLWIFGLYYVTCIFSGEVLLREIYSAMAYCLLPYAILILPIALFSNALGIENAGLIAALTNLVYVWVVLLVITSIREMNSYSIPATIGVIFISLIAVVFIAVILVLLYVLGVKLFDFIVELFKEYRILIFE